MTIIKRVRELTKPYDSCPLECDGLTRVLHTVLVRHKISHQVVTGTIWVGEEAFAPHFWLRLAKGYIVDYRARMWLGDTAPHGVFLPPSDVRYAGRPVEMENLPDYLFEILTEGC